jgi:hypothetical protein
MADNDTSEGPQVGQVVLYNNSSTIVPAIIYAVSSTTGSVSLNYFDSGGAHNVATSNYDSGVHYDGTQMASGRWTWMPYL